MLDTIEFLRSVCLCVYVCVLMWVGVCVLALGCMFVCANSSFQIVGKRHSTMHLMPLSKGLTTTMYTV